MSKYIIELKDDVQVVQKVGVTENGNAFVMNFYKDQLEELTSDYIKEHFGQLQDDAYQKGFEDGKAVNDKGCEGCKYGGSPQGSSPCYNCSNYYKNNWTEKDDKIEVGDEVEWGNVGGNGCKGIVLWIADNSVNGRKLCDIMSASGSAGTWHTDEVVKTGRHFDIASILEDMRK